MASRNKRGGGRNYKKKAKDLDFSSQFFSKTEKAKGKETSERDFSKVRWFQVQFTKPSIPSFLASAKSNLEPTQKKMPERPTFDEQEEAKDPLEEQPIVVADEALQELWKKKEEINNLILEEKMKRSR